MQKKIYQIIDSVLSGESKVEDDLYLIDWFDDNKENTKLFACRERLWNAVDIVLNKHKFDHGAAFNKFKAETRQKSFSKKIVAVTLRWAAVGLLLIGIGAAGYHLLRDRIIWPGADTFEIIVPIGARSNIRLSDGSSVWLNAGSSLTYSKSFGSDNRTVHLEGEGFFQVVDDSKHPFTVITSQLEIVALGTSFNVKSYPEEETIQTTLVSGSLMLNRIRYKSVERGLLLEPNQQVIYFRDSRDFLLTVETDKEVPVEEKNLTVTDTAEMSDPPKIILRHGVNPEVFTSWKDNRLIFENEPFESIAVKLERRFGARIIISDEEIKSKRFNGKFDEISMEQALGALKFASPFEYQIINDTVYISSH